MSFVQIRHGAGQVTAQSEPQVPSFRVHNWRGAPSVGGPAAGAGAGATISIGICQNCMAGEAQYSYRGPRAGTLSAEVPKIALNGC